MKVRIAKNILTELEALKKLIADKDERHLTIDRQVNLIQTILVDANSLAKAIIKEEIASKKSLKVSSAAETDSARLVA